MEGRRKGVVYVKSQVRGLHTNFVCTSTSTWFQPIGQTAHMHTCNTTVRKLMPIVQWETCTDHPGRKLGVFEIRKVCCVGLMGVWTLPY